MFIEYFSYLATFIATTGLAVIGTLVAYQCFQNLKTPVLQILLYQQIFLFSFFIYGIWGNLAIRAIVADAEIGAELSQKLAFYVPLLGAPFLITSWFMLVKFGFTLNGFKIPKWFVYFYFTGIIFGLFILTFLIHSDYLLIPGNPELIIVRTITALNLVIHLILLFPFIRPKNVLKIPFKKGEPKNTFFIYLGGVFVYSALLAFFGLFGFISTNLAILVLFGVSIIFPVRLKYLPRPANENSNGLDYKAFCSKYDISKREAEIVREICSGKTNKAIAEKLFITLQTVKDHTHRIYTKTYVKSRVQLANLVREKTGLKEL